MTNKALTVSIVIPAYNEENHLAACLDAIAAQTVAPDEVIVVDNNSTDKTVAVARQYPFVRILKAKKQGPLWARNKGFDSARSDILGRIDADTILPPDWVARIRAFYKAAEHANFALTGGCYFYNVRLPRFASWVQGQVVFRVNRLLLGHYITYGSNMAVPKKLWLAIRDKVCFRDDIHEDLDLSVHLHRAGYQISYDESIKVGVKMRRVRSTRRDLWANLMLWPQTLRVHGRWTWVFGWFGAFLLYALFPVVLVGEGLARVFGRTPLPE